MTEQCSGLRLSNWGSKTASACTLIKDFGEKAVIVVEGTHLPQDRGMTGNAAEQARFDEEVRSSCPEDIRIYSEDIAFAGASPWTQNRIHFGATPEDILQGRGRNTNAEPQAPQEEGPEAEPEELYEMGGFFEDGVQDQNSNDQSSNKPNEPKK
ncbi:MAG: hypothetical protein ACRC7P_10090 [Enterovibrio sp.]